MRSSALNCSTLRSSTQTEPARSTVYTSASEFTRIEWTRQRDFYEPSRFHNSQRETPRTTKQVARHCEPPLNWKPGFVFLWRMRSESASQPLLNGPVPSRIISTAVFREKHRYERNRRFGRHRPTSVGPIEVGSSCG